jgi:hypothetical protein
VPEYHAIITVQANNWFDAERAFDAAIRDDERLSLVRLASVPPDTSGEPHPRLEREQHADLFDKLPDFPRQGGRGRRAV